jgi:hypothetical protein
MGRRLGRMKRITGDEPTWVITHVCMETTQGIILCSYLYLKLTGSVRVVVVSSGRWWGKE